MTVVHGLVVVGVIVLVALAPCLICLIIVTSDKVVERTWHAMCGVGRRITSVGVRSRIGRRWQLTRFAHSLRVAPALERSEPAGPPIEQVAGDLRRLNRLRGGVATRSSVWFTAVQRAYDELLRLACRQLGVVEHLDGLTGMDLELERFRLESVLQRAGLALRDQGAEQR